MIKPSNISKPLILLDRDGTLNIDPGYLKDPDKLKLIEGVANSLAKLNIEGFEVIVVSNQSGIGRGLIKESEAVSVNKRLTELLLEENDKARISKLYYCPHAPAINCDCRKPKAGLVVDLLKLRDDMSNVWVVGDKLSDVLLGKELSLPLENCYLVLTGEGEAQYEKFLNLKNNSFMLRENVLKSLPEVVEKILKER